MRIAYDLPTVIFFFGYVALPSVLLREIECLMEAKDNITLVNKMDSILFLFSYKHLLAADSKFYQLGRKQLDIMERDADMLAEVDEEDRLLFIRIIHNIVREYENSL